MLENTKNNKNKFGVIIDDMATTAYIMLRTGIFSTHKMSYT